MALRLYSKRMALALFISVSLSMCKKPDDVKITESPVNTSNSRVYHDQLTRDFGKILAGVLVKEKGVRALIKEEALKKFDQDCDVLYQMIKDRPVGEGKTFRQVLLEHAGNESALKAIEKELPLLTILVPELPENSFSAATWNVDTQVPWLG